MAQIFTLNKPVQTTTPTVDVENNLPAGVHVFTLIVVDDEGNQSDPATAKVVVT